jgi:hypothetical protein
MKMLARTILFFTIVIAVSGCASKPMYGAKIHVGNFFCYNIDYESQNYQALVYDVNGDVVASADNLDVKKSTNRYLTGTCDITASFSKIPLDKGPYKIEYLVNGTKVDEYEFESLMEY